MFFWIKNFFTHSIRGRGNQVIAPKFSRLIIEGEGDNNEIFISPDARLSCKIRIIGSDNRLIVGSKSNVNLMLRIGSAGKGDGYATQRSEFRIGECTFMGRSQAVLLEDDSHIFIANKSAIAEGTQLYCSDTHSILDLTGRLQNIGRFIEIGDSVWVGNDVKIGKNVRIPKHTIVGFGSVVTREFSEENTIIGGNPAKILKRGVSWDKRAPQVLLNELMHTK